jgi:hypothetical protein
MRSETRLVSGKSQASFQPCWVVSHADDQSAKVTVPAEAYFG